MLTVMVITFILQIEKWSRGDEMTGLRCLQDVQLSLSVFFTGMLEIWFPTLSKSGGLVTSDNKAWVEVMSVIICGLGHFSTGAFNYYYKPLWCSKEMKCICGHSMVKSPHTEFLNMYVEQTPSSTMTEMSMTKNQAACVSLAVAMLTHLDEHTGSGG